jgi:hypothetical protein
LIPLVAASGLAIGVWCVLMRNAAFANLAAWGTVLEAVYLERFAAPRLTQFAQDKFGRIDASIE